MLNHLLPEEVYAVLRSLSDLYAKHNTGHGDLSITLHRESDQHEGTINEVTGFIVALDVRTATLGVGGPNVSHEHVPLSRIVRVTIER